MGQNLGPLNIKDTYQSLVQTSGSVLTDGTGSVITNVDITASFATTASYALNAETVDTGSLLKTASIADATTTYTKGDGTTFDLTVNNVANAVSASYAVTASYALNAGETVNTGSLMVTGSVSGQTLTFTKGDGTTFDLVVSATGSAAESLVTASIADATITFTKGDTSTFDITVNNVANASTATSASHAVQADNATTANSATTAVSASHAVNADSAISATSATTAVSASHALVADSAISATSAATATSASHALVADTAISATTATTANTASYVQGANVDGAVALATTASHALVADSVLGTIENATSASYVPTAMLTGSVNLNTLTFTKFDGSTFNLTVDTGSAGGTIDTGSFVQNASDTYTSTAKITEVVSLTQAEYNALATPASGTLYIVNDATGSLVVSASYALTASHLEGFTGTVWNGTSTTNYVLDGTALGITTSTNGDGRIIAGISASISATGSGHVILGGQNHQINPYSGQPAHPLQAAMIGGSGNKIEGGYQGAFIGGGNNNYIYNSTGFFRDQASAIVGGSNNTVQGAHGNFIGGGTSNSISNFVDRGVILGGSSNQLNGGGNNAAIINADAASNSGGQGSTIIGTGNGSMSSNQSIMAGGNQLNSSGNTYKVMLGGNGATSTNGEYSGIILGRNSNFNTTELNVVLLDHSSNHSNNPVQNLNNYIGNYSTTDDNSGYSLHSGNAHISNAFTKFEHSANGFFSNNYSGRVGKQKGNIIMGNEAPSTNHYFVSGSDLGGSNYFYFTGKRDRNGMFLNSGSTIEVSERTIMFGTDAVVVNDMTGSFILPNNGSHSYTEDYTLYTEKIHARGAVKGDVTALSVTSNTASMDCSLGNFFTLNLPSADWMLKATNISAGQTINLQTTQNATAATASFGTEFKFEGGTPFTPSTGSGAVDVMTFISFDGSTLKAVGLKDFR